jgi:poly(A) polymerase
MLLRDNVYGSVEEDAIRRDFTVNALYYTVHNFSVHDYTTGIEDLMSCNLRMIGNPILRYQEDPVRMLRAVRFATKLSFKIELNTAEPIPRMAKLLAEIPPARLFEEILKLFMAGHAMENFALLCHYRLFEQLFPQTSLFLADPVYQVFIEHACKNTDDRINSEKYVTPAFLFAVLLWPQVNELTKKFHLEGLSPAPARHEAIQVAIQQQLHHTAIPKRFSTPMREIWELQLALENVHSKRVYRILSHKRFRAAYDFLILREQAGEKIGVAAIWWTEFQQADVAIQQTMLDALKRGKSSGNRKHR